MISFVKEARKFFKGIKNLMIPRGIISVASKIVLINKIKDEVMPMRRFFDLFITMLRVMVLKINNQLTQRIYFCGIQCFQMSVLQL